MRLTDISPAAYLSESKARGLEIVRRTLKDALSGVCRPPRAVRRARPKSRLAKNLRRRVCQRSLCEGYARFLAWNSMKELYGAHVVASCRRSLFNRACPKQRVQSQIAVRSGLVRTASGDCTQTAWEPREGIWCDSAATQQCYSSDSGEWLTIHE